MELFYFILLWVWVLNSYFVARKIKIDLGRIWGLNPDEVRLDYGDGVMMVFMAALGPFGLLCMYVGSWFHFRAER